MRIEVDQSGKIEQLNLDTVIAFSNESRYSIFIPRKIKRLIFENCRMPNLTYRLFCIGIYYCISGHLGRLSIIRIDDEYCGKGHLVKTFLLQIIRKGFPDFKGMILFSQIGKKSNAHLVAICVFRRERMPDRILTENDIKKYL